MKVIGKRDIMLLFAAGAVLTAAFFYREPSHPPGEDGECRATDLSSEMRLIEGGSFLMGQDGLYPEELPPKPVTVGSFYMSTHEVTNREFAEFVAETNYVTVSERIPDPGLYPNIFPEFLKKGSAVFITPSDVSGGGDITQWWQFVEGADWRHPEGPDSTLKGREAYPVVHVALEDAQAFAAWKGHRLPTEAEFEWAARGGRQASRFAWGEELTPGGQYKANFWQGLFPLLDTAADGYAGLAPVGCFEPNSYQLYDLIGNVWEWTADSYYPAHDFPASGRATGFDPNQPGLAVHVIKGGSYLCSPNFCQRYRPAARQPQDIAFSSNHIGFRTVLDVPE